MKKNAEGLECDIDIMRSGGNWKGKQGWDHNGTYKSQWARLYLGDSGKTIK